MSQPPPASPQPARYSLASILLLTAVVAIYAGALRAGIVAAEASRRPAVGIGAACGLIAGFILGIFLGQGADNRARGTAMGALVGSLSGMAAGAMVPLPESLVVIIPGALVLLGFALLVRRLSRTGAEDDPPPTAPGP